MLGTVAAWFDFDWPEAERHFQFAMALTAPWLRWYIGTTRMYCLLPTGRAQEAIDNTRSASKRTP